MMKQATSAILYVRASLKPFLQEIKQAGDIISFLKQFFIFDEIFVPHFFSARPFWRAPRLHKVTNSGALGKMVANYNEAVISRHPSHSFAGVGSRVTDVLDMHDQYYADAFKTWKDWYVWFVAYCKESGMDFISYRDAIAELEGQ